jgi:hypothetical protein
MNKDPLFEIFIEPLLFYDSEVKRYKTIHHVCNNDKKFLGVKRNYEAVVLNKSIFDISQKIIADFLK